MTDKSSKGLLKAGIIGFRLTTYFRIGSTILVAGLTVFVVSSQAWAEPSGMRLVGESYLDSYEPNTLGYTLDDDDVPFLDVKLSVKALLAPTLVHKASPNLHWYLGLTGRFGQYIGTRESSPVIGKRFNPEMFLRYQLSGKGHVDLGYGHESNGQAITSPEAFDQARMNAERQDFANDFISRGWDYIRISLKTPFIKSDNSIDTLTGTLVFRYFLPNGFLQGSKEEYNDWEDDSEGKDRDEVHGVRGLLKYIWPFDQPYFNGFKTVAVYETGYNPIFRFNSIRFEQGFKIFEIPMMVWMSSGYNSDLAQYYKRVFSLGAAYVIGGF